MTARELGIRLAIAALLIGSNAHAQRGSTPGEWRSYSGDAASSKYSALDQIDKTNVARLSDRVAPPRARRPIVTRSRRRMRAGRTFREHAAHDRRRAVRAERLRFRRSVRSRHRQDAVGRAAARAGAERLSRHVDTRHRLLGERCHDRRILCSITSTCSRSIAKTGRPIASFGDERPCVSIGRPRRGHALHVDGRAVRDRRRRRARHVAVRRFREQGSHAQRRARLRRAHRATALARST